ncbi:hypothetical protein llap_6092 [Limosa lapponica baueri]|uniref:Uncharacterized protein n=1 Tax=Limosa lapponica baueri TaxID=1758121 RepID=A0A2I0UC36_LIMLA|nr:hypothetical protein llap_6092 [Limosa lapponica baueri]
MPSPPGLGPVYEEAKRDRSQVMTGSFKSQLDLLFTAKEELLGDMTINISLDCSDHEIVGPEILNFTNDLKEVVECILISFED